MELYSILLNKNRSTAVWLTRFLGREPQWEDLTAPNLSRFNEFLHQQVSQNSARTYLASLKAVINLYREDKGLKCGDLGVVMKAKSVKSTHTYLTPDELSVLESLQNLTPNQRDVRDMFLLQAWTGCRISDAKNLTLDNIIDGVLSYTSIKTHTYTSVPVKPIVESIIKRVGEIRTFPRATYNRIISELCWDADIINEVTLFKGGKQIKGEKWQFVSSHTARRSFATNLYNAGIETSSIAHMMGHGSISMTERYICCSFLDMNDKVKSFFK